MVVNWYNHLSLWVISGFTLAAYTWWLNRQPEFEPTAALYIAAFTFVVLTIGIPIHYIFDESRQKRRASQREEKRKVLDRVLDCIDGEMKNFQQIESKRTCNSAAHRDAVEVASFKLLADEIQKLKPYRNYRRTARRILKEIGRNYDLPDNGKDVSLLIPMLEALRPRIEKELNALGGPVQW